MRTRDKSILKDLERFRCMSRDDIADIHFSHLKQPITSCNMVLKRMRRDGHIEANTDMQPFTYFPSPSPMKKNSQKIPHFLSIVNFYRQLIKYDTPKIFEVEPKVSRKGGVEPDVFMSWRGAVFFVEIQNSLYSEKQMQEKMQRYEQYARSREWESEPWQGNKPVFPLIWIVGEGKFNSGLLRIVQSKSVDEMMEKIRKSS